MLQVGAVSVSGTNPEPEKEGQRPLYNISTSMDDPGLIFSDLFQFKIVQDYWTVVSSISSAPLVAQIACGRKLFNSYRALVNNNDPDKVMHIQLQHMEKDLREVENDLKIRKTLFSGNETEPQNRERRGLINSIGSALKVIAGTLDASDAEYFSSKIEQISEGAHGVY